MISFFKLLAICGFDLKVCVCICHSIISTRSHEFGPLMKCKNDAFDLKLKEPTKLNSESMTEGFFNIIKYNQSLDKTNELNN